MSLGWVETDKPTESHMPTGLIITGIILAAVGGIIMGVANKQKDEKQAVSDLTDRMLGYEPGSLGENSAVQQMITLGYVGLGVLIFGALLALIGITVVAMRR